MKTPITPFRPLIIKMNPNLHIKKYAQKKALTNCFVSASFSLRSLKDLNLGPSD